MKCAATLVEECNLLFDTEIPYTLSDNIQQYEYVESETFQVADNRSKTNV